MKGLINWELRATTVRENRELCKENSSRYRFLTDRIDTTWNILPAKVIDTIISELLLNTIRNDTLNIINQMLLYLTGYVERNHNLQKIVQIQKPF